MNKKGLYNEEKCKAHGFPVNFADPPPDLMETIFGKINQDGEEKNKTNAKKTRS